MTSPMHHSYHIDEITKKFADHTSLEAVGWEEGIA